MNWGRGEGRDGAEVHGTANRDPPSALIGWVARMADGG
jgi:hypothetical protein